MTLPTFAEEQALRAAGHRRVAGVDEAGRGPLAGPVVAAAVVLPEAWYPRRGSRPRHPVASLLRDSKQLTHRERECLYAALVAQVLWAAAVVPAATIDADGILRATRAAMRQALGALVPQPDAVLVDAVPLEGLGFPCRAIIRGDARCASIAAASIVAKVTRDRLMRELDAAYPGYGFARHKGYGTPEHLRHLSRLGPTPAHRRSFAPVRALLGEGGLR